MRARHRLSAAFVKNAPPGKHCDGGGLYLVKRDDGGAQWVLRVTVYGNRREMGLGSASDVSLREAREEAEKWRSVAARGGDPIKEREEQRLAANKDDIILRKMAHAAFDARKAQLKGDGKAGRWFSPLEVHVLPKLGKIPVDEITQLDVKRVLEPIWHTKAVTAQKALNRLQIVMRYAAAGGHDVDLQATAKAKELLGESRHEETNIEALPWQDVPDFYASLDEGTVSHLALRLLILTGMRSTPIRLLRLDHLDGDLWTIPEAVIKGPRKKKKKKAQTEERKDFRVPLSAEAQRVVGLALPHARDGYLFPGDSKPEMSDGTMAMLMKRRGMKARPHGFRSSLRTWLADTTDAPHEVAETVLGHVTGSSVVRAYRRTDYLEQRRILMERWAQFVTGQGGQVVRLANV